MPDSFDAMLRAMITEVVREEIARLLPSPAEYLSTATAAKLADVAPGTIRRWIRAGRLKAHRAGRVVRVKRADLEHFLAEDNRVIHELTPEQLAERDFGSTWPCTSRSRSRWR